MAGTITCDRCGGLIHPDQFATVESDGRRHFHRECPAASPAGEFFCCDDCSKKFPVQLLREGKAGIASERIFCPRCLIKNVGLQRRKVDAWMVATVVLIVLVFPIAVGMILSAKGPEDLRVRAPGADGLSSAAPLPGSRRATAPIDRDQLAEILREVLAEEMETNRDPDPTVDQKPDPLPEEEPEDAVAGPVADRTARTPKQDPIVSSEPESESKPEEPGVELALLEKEIDRALRNALFERLNASHDPEALPARMAAITAIRTAGQASWAVDLEPYVTARAEDELIRGLAAATVADLGATASTPSLRRAANDRTSDLVREASRQALFDLLGEGTSTPPADQDIDWSGALERHERATKERGR